MKKLPDNLETLLHSQKETGLTVSEKETMFAELQAFAALHSPVVADTPRTPKRSLFIFSKWSIAVASVFLMTVGTGAAATKSLPGDSLYGVKVSVVEPLVALAYFSEADQLVYQIVLMERRLEEMETLYRADELTVTEVAVLEEQIVEHTNDFSDLLTVADESSLPAEVTLEAVSTVTVTLKKQSFLADRRLGTNRTSPIDTVESALATLYQAELEDFLTEEPAVVTEYVTDLLAEVDEKISTDPDTASSSALELSDHLEDIQGTLEEGDLKEVIESAEEASQLLETNSFFDEITSADGAESVSDTE